MCSDGRVSLRNRVRNFAKPLDVAMSCIPRAENNIRFIINAPESALTKSHVSRAIPLFFQMHENLLFYDAHIY